MVDNAIICPQCGFQFEISDALTNQIEQAYRQKHKAEIAASKKDYQAKLKEINQKAKELEEKGQAIDEQIAEQVKVKQKIIAEQERKKILAEQAEQTKALEEELEEKRKQLSEANKKELELRKQQQKLEEEKEAFELTVQRKLDEGRKKIAEQASKKAAEEQQLKMREKEDLIKAMQSQIEQLKRKAEIGSQEAQGEALEQELQELLERTFPIDKFKEIKKGAKGADILQTVHNSTGKDCGTILWESKNTKDFQKGWIEKLKKDQQDKNTDIAVIMSITLPNEINNFGLYEGIWITDYKSSVGLATALRQVLIEVSRQKVITAGREGIKDFVYNYITGKEFMLHIQAVVNAYKQMLEDLEGEKRSMNRIWKKREKQIDTVLSNVTGIVGSIQGLVGGEKALPQVEPLTLEAIADEEESIID